MFALKKTVIEEVVKVTRAMLATATEGRMDAIIESRHHKGAMESRYDTFKEDAQYLMAAQEARMAELNSTIATLGALLARPNAASGKVTRFSLVELEDGLGIRSSYLILPAGGGVACTVNEIIVTTINESSPLARALSGKSEGEEAEINVAGNKKTFSIITVV